MARLAIAGAGIALVGITILRHELWRDELQAWQIARASHGFHSLVHNTRYEGHPLLWFGLLYPIAHAHAGPGAMQLLQFFIASTTISVAVWRAPFTQLQKLLFVFGYFVLYEYGVLSRSYGLGAMCLVIALALAGTSAPRRWGPIGALLGLVALTSAFGAVVAIAVLAGLGVDEWFRRRDDGFAGAPNGAVLLGGLLTFAGLATAYLQAAHPPSDTGNYSHWRTSLDVGLGASSMASVWRALVPIPSLERSYWNSNILSARAAVVGVLGFALFVLVAWILRDRPGSFVVWVSGVVLVVGFLYARIGTATASRHIGHIFLCLVAAMWLAPFTWSRAPSSRHEAPTRFSGFPIARFITWSRARSSRHEASTPLSDLTLTRSITRSRARSSRHEASPPSPDFTLTRSARAASVRSRWWTLLLFVQVIAGLFAVGLDLAYPFSNGRDVAQYIQRKGFDHFEIVGLPDTAASTVAGYLDRPIYYLTGSRTGTFVVWNTARNQVQPLEAVLRTQPPFETGPPVLVLSNRPIDDPNVRLRLLVHFDNGIVGDEHYWLYLGEART
ncbi:MAG TPA: hypothetical protein VIK61_16890 [Acidimicrobiia bacterium]